MDKSQNITGRSKTGKILANIKQRIRIWWEWHREMDAWDSSVNGIPMSVAVVGSFIGMAVFKELGVPGMIAGFFAGAFVGFLIGDIRYLLVLAVDLPIERETQRRLDVLRLSCDRAENLINQLAPDFEEAHRVVSYARRYLEETDETWYSGGIEEWLRKASQTAGWGMRTLAIYMEALYAADSVSIVKPKIENPWVHGCNHPQFPGYAECSYCHEDDFIELVEPLERAYVG